ncbi:free fatty acid receptor 3-like [Cyrtonyx montezumae]|uniref:free fatty acid receptor 3-like n=1 Tax=Cyrtonyx montezumae TaxID=9017 RepID=UPI0032D9B620
MLILIVHALTFAVGLPANVFTIAALLAKTRRPRPHLTAADLLLLHLTAADLLLLLFLPFKMAEAAAGMTWPFPTALCPIANFCFFSSIYLSTLFMAALAVERYLGVAHPHRHGRRRRLRRTAAACAVLWVLAMSHCSVVFVAEYHRAFGANGSEDVGGRGFGVEIGGSGEENPNGVDPVGLKVDTSRRLGVTGPTPGGNVWVGPHGADPTTSAGDITAPSASESPRVHTSNPKPDLDPPPSPRSPSPTTPNGVRIPTSAPRTSENPTATQPPSAFRCYDDFSAAQLRFVLLLRLELCLVLYLLPFSITTLCYVRLILTLLPRPHIPREKKHRTVGLAVVTVVNFGVCFAPYNLSHVVGFVQQHSPTWRPYALILTTLSAALDPFVFYFSSSAVRMAVSGAVGAVRGRICRVWGRRRRRE